MSFAIQVSARVESKLLVTRKISARLRVGGRSEAVDFDPIRFAASQVRVGGRSAAADFDPTRFAASQVRVGGGSEAVDFDPIRFAVSQVRVGGGSEAVDFDPIRFAVSQVRVGGGSEAVDFDPIRFAASQVRVGGRSEAVNFDPIRLAASQVRVGSQSSLLGFNAIRAVTIRVRVGGGARSADFSTFQTVGGAVAVSPRATSTVSVTCQISAAIHATWRSDHKLETSHDGTAKLRLSVKRRLKNLAYARAPNILVALKVSAVTEKLAPEIGKPDAIVRRYEGDPLFVLTPDGSELVFENGNPVMTRGIENAVLLTLFSDDSWPGNELLPLRERIGSDFEKQARGAVTLATVNSVRQSAEAALSGLGLDGKVSVNNPKNFELEVTIKIASLPQTEVQLTRTSAGWLAQRRTSDAIT